MPTLSWRPVFLAVAFLTAGLLCLTSTEPPSMWFTSEELAAFRNVPTFESATGATLQDQTRGLKLKEALCYKDYAPGVAYCFLSFIESPHLELEPYYAPPPPVEAPLPVLPRPILQ